jgi:hypothetical protein
MLGSTLAPGTCLVHPHRLELGRPAATQSVSGGSPSAALVGSSVGNQSSAGRLEKE